MCLLFSRTTYLAGAIVRRAKGHGFRTLIVSGMVLALAAAVLGLRRRRRLNVARQASRNATERWEDEGGAVRAQPAQR
jgi:hypothetical protein